MCLGDRLIPAASVIWAAGVTVPNLKDWLLAETDRTGRVAVEPDLSLSNHPNVFVIGDAASIPWRNGMSVPGIAPAAKQGGRYAAEVILAAIDGKRKPTPFRYRHRGNLATRLRAESGCSTISIIARRRCYPSRGFSTRIRPSSCSTAIRKGPCLATIPKSPDAPAMSYHTYTMAGLRLVLDVEVAAGNEHASKHAAPGLWALLDRIPRDCWPAFLRGDSGFGTEAVMREAERRGLPYLFKLRLTAER